MKQKIQQVVDQADSDIKNLASISLISLRLRHQQTIASFKAQIKQMYDTNILT